MMKRLIYGSLLFLGFLGGSVAATAEAVPSQSSRTNVMVTIKENPNIVPHSNEIIPYTGTIPNKQNNNEPLKILPHTNAINSLMMTLLGVDLVMGTIMLYSLKKKEEAK